MSSVLEFDASQWEQPAARLHELEGEMATAAGMANASDGRLVDAMAKVIGERMWQGDRIHTPVQWLMWRTGTGRRKARQIVLLAARAADLPTTVGLLREGRLSLDQAATVARYTPGPYEASVCKVAVHASVQQIVNATKDYAFDVEAKPPRQRPDRQVLFGHDRDGDWWARISLPADEGAVVEAALRTARDRLHTTARQKAKDAAAAADRPADGTDAELGVAPLGWPDALVGMANAVLGTDATGAERRARPAVHVHLERPVPGCGQAWVAELHGGPGLPDSIRRYLTCDCDLDITIERDGTPYVSFRSRRTPPDKLRRAIERRDGHRCRVPGCDTSLWLDVHHIVHWEDHGPTTTPNLCCLCPKHHRHHHRGLLAITGDADAPPGTPGALTFTDPTTGRTLTPLGPPTPPGPDGLPGVAPYPPTAGIPFIAKDLIEFHRNDEPPGHRQPTA